MSQSTALELTAPGPADTLNLGSSIARALSAPAEGPFVIALRGELGAGKTTLVRGLLRALGVTGTVRSPTFTLLENYSVPSMEITHLDLYRVEAPQEIEALGVRDLLEPGRVLLIEWPERGQDSLPATDLEIAFSVAPAGRRIAIAAASTTGERVLARLRSAVAQPEL